MAGRKPLLTKFCIIDWKFETHLCDHHITIVNLPAAFQVRLGPRNDAMSESCVRRTTGPASTGSGSISSQYLSLCIPGKLTATDFGFNLIVFHPKYLIHEGKK